MQQQQQHHHLKYRISSEQQYVYHKLSEPAKGSTQPYNVYGVIIDAGLPYVKTKCLCSIKMMDDTLNSKCARSLAAAKPMINLQMQMFANNTNELPSIYRIGDIIRIHRANIGEYQGQLQLNANVYLKTAWVIFSGNSDYEHSYEIQKPEKKEESSKFIRLLGQEEEQKLMDDLKRQTQLNQPSEAEEKESEIQQYAGKLPEKAYTPILSSSQAYSFHDSEKAIIDKLRKWSQDFFKSTQILDTETHIQGQQIGQDGSSFFRDFDLLGKLTQIDLIDDKFCNILIKDLSGVVYQLRVNLSRIKLPQKGQIIRIRSAKLASAEAQAGTSKNPIRLELSNHSNILHIPQYFKQALMLNERIIEDDVLKQLMLGSDLTQNEILNGPQIISFVQSKHQDMNFTSLYDIFHSYNKDKLLDHFLRVRVFALGILPQNIREMTQLYCPKCIKTFSFKDIETDSTIPLEKQVYLCPQCCEQGSPIYMTCLICKDDSTSGIDKCYKILYYSNDQQPGEEFFGGLKATNLYKDERSREIVGKYLQILTRFNIYLDLVIKRKYVEQTHEDLFLIIDGKIRSYHQEEQKN